MVIRSFLDAMNITLYIAGCVLIGFGINASISICSLHYTYGNQMSHILVIKRVYPPLSFSHSV